MYIINWQHLYRIDQCMKVTDYSGLMSIFKLNPEAFFSAEFIKIHLFVGGKWIFSPFHSFNFDRHDCIAIWWHHFTILIYSNYIDTNYTVTTQHFKLSILSFKKQQQKKKLKINHRLPAKKSFYFLHSLT